MPDPETSRRSWERPSTFDAPFCASAFKIMVDPYVGHLTWVRVVSGRLNAGESIYNSRTGEVVACWQDLPNARR